MRIKVLVSFLGIALAATMAAGQATASPAVKQAQKWLTAFNSGDRTTVKKFVEQDMPARASDVDRFMMFRDRTGGFELRHIDEATATDDDLRELKALYRRYGGDTAQLARLNGNKNA